jgi:1-acyl-sn-glycerol-3-phosphate acyltransferase
VLAIRSALVFLIMAVTVIPLATVLVISSFIAPYRVTYFWIGRPWLQLAIAATKYVGGVTSTVKGYDNLLAAAPGNRVIICSKHQSTYETFFFPSVMTNPVAYVYKKELNWVPFFGWAIGRLHMVPIDRSAKGDAWQRVARIGAKLMDQGKWIIMFPRGNARGARRSAPLQIRCSEACTGDWSRRSAHCSRDRSVLAQEDLALCAGKG